MKEKVMLPEGFFLGAAASAWQTEGWIGKKEDQDSYMDKWYMEHKAVWHDGYGPAIATNFIERYQEDITYMKEIGLNCYRTSLNWSRFLLNYENAVVDEHYAAYYADMLEECIKNGITPMVCLEHYELPYVLMEKYGGWNSRYVVELFLKYAGKAFEYFSSKVKYWFVFNEPVVIQTRVYLDAQRWPFKQDSKVWMQWNYNKALATALVMAAFKDLGLGKDGGKLGTIINVESAYARSDSHNDRQAAYMYDLFFNKVFLDPALKGRYEDGFFELLKQHGIMMETDPADAAIFMNNQVDWVGINLYHPNRVKERSTAVRDGAAFHPNFFYEKFKLPGRKMNPFRGWEIYPQIMYDFGIRMKTEYGNKAWFIAENGIGVENEKQYKDKTGIIQDDYRIDFIKQHLYYALKSAKEGSNLKGYMLWAFTDNVSPMNAFKNRYGLIEIDLEDNRSRHLKKSAYFYQNLIAHGFFEYVNDEKEYK